MHPVLGHSQTVVHAHIVHLVALHIDHVVLQVDVVLADHQEVQPEVQALEPVRQEAVHQEVVHQDHLAVPQVQDVINR